MPCLVGCLALAAPRFAIVLVVVFSDYVGRAYDTVLWPLLGFFFMPLSALSYAWAINSRGSLYLNFDADNNSTGEALRITKDTSTDTGGTALFTVNDEGHVGIGTDSPEHPLDVRGAAGDEVRIGSPDGVPVLHHPLTGDSA